MQDSTIKVAVSMNAITVFLILFDIFRHANGRPCETFGLVRQVPQVELPGRRPAMRSGSEGWGMRTSRRHPPNISNHVQRLIRFAIPLAQRGLIRSRNKERKEVVEKMERRWKGDGKDFPGQCYIFIS